MDIQRDCGHMLLSQLAYLNIKGKETSVALLHTNRDLQHELIDDYKTK